MRFGKGIFGVYAPVLVAAVMILTVAPTCLMPACGPAGVAVAAVEQPESGFISACGLEDPRAPQPEPCHGGDCDDSVMSHGAPEAVVVNVAETPSPLAVAIAHAPEVAAASLAGDMGTLDRLPDTHPPDPLGVRLLV